MKRCFFVLISMVIAAFCLTSVGWSSSIPGTKHFPSKANRATINEFMVTETGYISMSIDGIGTNEASGIIQVEKPPGATVRSAFLFAATKSYGGTIGDGDVTLDGTAISWDFEVPSAISSNSYNYGADITAVVSSRLNSAPAGRVDFTINEVNNNSNIDGEILAVIFEDPNQSQSNTAMVLFGAQDTDGDTFNIGLSEPLDLTMEGLVLDFSLGISFGYQTESINSQYSIVDVNGVRLTSSAGGQDDGASEDGALITVGGLDDSNDNPADPEASPTNWDSDDELYNLIPFVSHGDKSIRIETENPSDDDNILFAALFMTSTTAVLNEGAILTPTVNSNTVGATQIFTAKLQNSEGNVIIGREVVFEVNTGPHKGYSSSGTTNANGEVTWSYIGVNSGTDHVVARFMNSNNEYVYSNTSRITWTEECTSVVLVSPSGEIQDSSPSFTWLPSECATWYYVWVNSGLNNVFSEWYAADQVCDGQSCSVISPINLDAGDYTWWIQVYSDNGYGPWSDGMEFSIEQPFCDHCDLNQDGVVDKDDLIHWINECWTSKSVGIDKTELINMLVK